MAEREKVEGFRLTKEQVNFTKKYREFNKVFGMIQGQFFVKAGETKRLGELLEGMEEKMQIALRLAPKEPVRELEGQEPPKLDGEQGGAEGQGAGGELSPEGMQLNF